MVLCLVSELEILGSRYVDPFVQESSKVRKIEKDGIINDRYLESIQEVSLGFFFV